MDVILAVGLVKMVMVAVSLSVCEQPFTDSETLSSCRVWLEVADETVMGVVPATRVMVDVVVPASSEYVTTAPTVPDKSNLASVPAQAASLVEVMVAVGSGFTVTVMLDVALVQPLLSVPVTV